MVFSSISEYLEAAFSPLKYVLLAYELGVGGDAEALARLLDIEKPPKNGAKAWELFRVHEKRLSDDAGESMRAGVFLPLERMCAAFALNPFERFVLMLALAAETDFAYRTVISSCLGSVTLGALLRLYSASARECVVWRREWLSKQKRLEFIFESGVLNANLELRPSALRFLLGLDIMPSGCSLFTPGSPLPDSLTDCGASESISRQMSTRPLGNLFMIAGHEGSGRKYQIKRFARDNRRNVLFAQHDKLDCNVPGIALFVILTESLLCVCGVPPGVFIAPKLIEELHPDNLFVTCGNEPPTVPEGYSAVMISIPPLSHAERLGAWQTYAFRAPVELSAFATQYRFTAGQVKSACDLAWELATSRGIGEVSATLLHEACRRQLPGLLGKLAVPAGARFTWEDLILPPQQEFLLRHICNQVKWRDTVYGCWGFEKKVLYGRGVRALFCGPPGTGKTMAAQVIATELNMELYKVDIASLVSKYIGETEKNLDEVFTEADRSGGILFFDEADAIFGKRGEQKDSHDKYANMQTSFLLQRFENYDGIVLLATNYAANLDPAFMRRIQNRVDFPMPSREYRRRIWEGLMIRTAPFAEDVDICFLADNFELTGSEIKNIVTQSAFLAAPEKNGIRMNEIITSLVMEYAKMDKLLSSKELGEYAYLAKKF